MKFFRVVKEPIDGAVSWLDASEIICEDCLRKYRQPLMNCVFGATFVCKCGATNKEEKKVE